MVVTIFARNQPGLTPAAAYPDIAMSAMTPMAAHPNRVRVGAGRPTSNRPNPVTAPFPAARNPKPKVQRPGSDCHDFNLRWRRIFRLLHDYLVTRRWRRGRLHHGHSPGRAFNNTPCEQWQADGNQKAFR
jgi:hypothetical protein